MFPSAEERTVASALLLLSHTIPQSLKLKSKSNDDDECISLSSKSYSVTSSTITTGTGSSFKANRSSSQKLSRIVAVVSRHPEMKFKVVRKKRSQVSWRREVVLALPATASFRSESSTEEAVSCISSTSSAAASSAPTSRYLKNRNSYKANSNKNPKRSSGSSKMSHKADAILKILSSRGCSSEVQIRQALGDSPDTSKALRMLLKQEEVKRSGTGGRTDPYIYKIA